MSNNFMRLADLYASGVCLDCGGFGCDNCMWEGTEEARQRLKADQAELKMTTTGKLEGAHYAAMTQFMKELREAEKEKPL